ncbi:Transient receptor putative cation channel sub V member 6 [Podochytrium sp. JEL0797]|nr:Transient receptor putative cation channel sub V member 6 [Podochytrium sp. JEL0797]
MPRETPPHASPLVHVPSSHSIGSLRKSMSALSMSSLLGKTGGAASPLSGTPTTAPDDSPSRASFVINEQPKSALWRAVMSGDVAEMDERDLKHSDIESVRNSNGETILHVAARRRNLETAAWIVTRFPSLLNSAISFGEDQGKDALQLAIESDRLDIVKLLIESGATINRASISQVAANTALNCAVTNASSTLEIVQYLVENEHDPADIAAVDFQGNNAFHALVMHQHFDVKLLTHRESSEHGSAFDSAPDTPRTSSQSDPRALVESLAAYLHYLNSNNPTADMLKSRNKDNLTPVQLAVQLKHPINYKDLFVHSTNQMALIKDGNLWQAVHDGNLERVRKFSRQILTLDGQEVGRRGDYERGGEGETILHMAILQSLIEVVEWIVNEFPSLVNELYQKKNAFANIDETRMHAKTLREEHEGNEVSPAEFNLHEGDGSMYFGQTILRFATASQWRVEIMKYLVESAFDPADLPAVDFHGNNVMHILAFHGDIDIELDNYLRARNLSDNKQGKTDINIHTARNLKKRMTPFQMGIWREHQSVIETMKVIRWEFGPNRQYSVDIQGIDPLQPDLDTLNDGKPKIWKRSSASALELAVKINKAVITNRVFE